MIFSMRRAPPPPLIMFPTGSTSSAPSITRSRRDPATASFSVKTGMPSARASSSVCRLVDNRAYVSKAALRQPRRHAARGPDRRGTGSQTQSSFRPARTDPPRACPAPFSHRSIPTSPAFRFANLQCNVYYEAEASVQWRRIPFFRRSPSRVSRPGAGRSVYRGCPAHDRVLEQGRRRADGVRLGQHRGKELHGPDLLDHRTVLGESLCTEETCPWSAAWPAEAGGTVPHIILANTASGQAPAHLPQRGAPACAGRRDRRGHRAVPRHARGVPAAEARRGDPETHDHAGGFTRNGVRVDTLFVPVDEIGGDFLEAFFLDEHTLIATLADATGHGISASLFTMVYKTLLHGSFARHRDPGRVLEQVNKGFLESAGIDGYYIGACLVSYDTASPHGPLRRGRSPPGLIFEKEGRGHRLREHLGVQSLMLGMNEAARFGEVEFQLGTGELLLLTSDGMIESPCRDGSSSAWTA